MWTLTARARRAKDLTEETDPALLQDFPGTDDELAGELQWLSAENRARPSGERERMILHLRNLLGIRRLEGAAPDAAYPEPDFDALPAAGGLPEITPGELTPGVLRAGILRDGCLLVRGLVGRGAAQELAGQIDRAFTERERHDADRSFNDRLYVPFEHDPRRGVRLLREWIKAGGGVLAVDSPRLSFQMGETFTAAGLPQLVAGYLGEPPVISGDKTTLRKAEPAVSGGWHQDGTFMGEVRALNLWLALSRCGDEAPGLDLVPRRLDGHVATETDEAMMTNQVSQRIAEEVAGEAGILRPIFEPGDALFFDELFLHKTASDPRMRRPRYAIENWFFGASAFPADYVPLS